MTILQLQEKAEKIKIARDFAISSRESWIIEKSKYTVIDGTLVPGYYEKVIHEMQTVVENCDRDMAILNNEISMLK